MRSSSGLLCEYQRQVHQPLGCLVSTAASQSAICRPVGLSPLSGALASSTLKIPASHNTSLESVHVKAESSWCLHTLLNIPLWEKYYPTWTPPRSKYALLIFSQEIINFRFSLNFFCIHLLRRGTNGGVRGQIPSFGDQTQVLGLLSQCLYSLSHPTCSGFSSVNTVSR